MSQQYANNQPHGFNNHLQKVAIVGAGGQCGKYIVEELLRNGKHKITAITRIDSTSKIPDGVDVKKVDYNDQSTLVTALQGQDALVITMGVTAPHDQQSKLVEAAATANVPWVIPNEFGPDDTSDEVSQDIMIGVMKKKERDHIEKLGKSSWIGVACSFWYEFSLVGGEDRYGFDMKNRAVTFFDDGTRSINTSTWSQTGRAVANLLALKVLPDDENDKSPCLQNYKNKFVRVSSFNLSQKQMLESLMRVTNTTTSDWKIDSVPVKKRYEDAKAELQKGNRAAFAKLLYSRMFFPDNAGNYELTKGLDNEKLNLPKEDLDTSTKIAVQMYQDGCFDSQYHS